mgnify:CR=1 FL=1
METRKIQTVGGGTYTISVPKAWASEQGFEAGETVRIYTHRDGSLIVRGREADAEILGPIRIPVEDRVTPSVERSIQATYESGFERITLVAEEAFTDEQRRAARTFARQLIGTEAVETGRTEIVIRVLLDASAVSIRQSIDQAASIVASMQRTVVEGLTGGETAVATVRDRRSEVGRLVALVRRHHTRSLVSFAELDALGIDRVPLSRYNRTADRIDRIAAATVRLAEAVDDAQPAEDSGTILAERTRTLRSELEEASNRVLERTNADSTLEAVTAGRGSAAIATLSDGETLSPSFLRIADILRCIDDHVRTIERIGMQSAVHRSTAPSVDL